MIRARHTHLKEVWAEGNGGHNANGSQMFNNLKPAMIPESSPKCIKPPRSFISPERSQKQGEKKTRISDKAIAYIHPVMLFAHTDFSFRF